MEMKDEDQEQEIIRKMEVKGKLTNQDHDDTRMGSSSSFSWQYYTLPSCLLSSMISSFLWGCPQLHSHDYELVTYNGFQFCPF